MEEDKPLLLALVSGDIRDDEEFTDVTLAWEDGLPIEAHKAILVGWSPQTNTPIPWSKLEVCSPIRKLSVPFLGPGFVEESETLESKTKERCKCSSTGSTCPVAMATEIVFSRRCSNDISRISWASPASLLAQDKSNTTPKSGPEGSVSHLSQAVTFTLVNHRLQFSSVWICWWWRSHKMTSTFSYRFSYFFRVFSWIQTIFQCSSKDIAVLCQHR